MTAFFALALATFLQTSSGKAFDAGAETAARTADVESVRVVHLRDGGQARVVHETKQRADHVVLVDARGKKQAESWCWMGSGSYDGLSVFFKRFQEAVASGDSAAVARLVRFPFRV